MSGANSIHDEVQRVETIQADRSCISCVGAGFRWGPTPKSHCFKQSRLRSLMWTDYWNLNRVRKYDKTNNRYSQVYQLVLPWFVDPKLVVALLHHTSWSSNWLYWLYSMACRECFVYGHCQCPRVMKHQWKSSRKKSPFCIVNWSGCARLEHNICTSWGLWAYQKKLNTLLKAQKQNDYFISGTDPSKQA